MAKCVPLGLEEVIGEFGFDADGSPDPDWGEQGVEPENPILRFDSLQKLKGGSLDRFGTGWLLLGARLRHPRVQCEHHCRDQRDQHDMSSRSHRQGSPVVRSITDTTFGLKMEVPCEEKCPEPPPGISRLREKFFPLWRNNYPFWSKCFPVPTLPGLTNVLKSKDIRGSRYPGT